MESALFVVTLIFSIMYALFLVWCIYGWIHIAVFKSGSFGDGKKKFVTVIIPARNEEAVIHECLSDFIHQDYSADSYEVIVADDHSTDRTAAVVEQFMKENPSLQIRLLKVHDSERKNAFKKHAITRAIAQAAGELIITTDADCRRGPGWLSTMVFASIDSGVKMLSAPVNLNNERGWFEGIQSLEFMGLVSIGAASIENRKPFLCNGANLAFNRQSFFDVGGYGSSNEISSGDDTLLLQKIAGMYSKTGNQNGWRPIRFVKSPDATVYTDAQHSLHSLLQQRKRWASKIPVQMGPFTVFIAVVAFLLHAGLMLSALSLFFRGNFTFLLIPLLIKMLPEFVLLFNAATFFKKRALLFLFLPAQIIYPVYIFVVGVASITGNYQWKGRREK